MSDLQLGVLGPLRVHHNGQPVSISATKQRTVLALLALRAGNVVPTDQLIAAVWGDDPPATAPRTLQSLVSRLRAALPGATPVISRRPPGYQLDLPPERVDAHEFAQLVAEAADQPAAQAAATLRRALDLWCGPALADLPRTPAIEAEAVRLAEQHDAAQGDYLDAELQLGRHHQVLSQLHALTAAEPLRERTWRQLMLALYRSDRQADALAAYRRARTVLTTELGIEPGPELQELHQRILAADPALAPPAPEPPPTPPGRASVPRQLPADPAATFTGRVAELAQLDSLLATAAGRRPVVISAIGGMAGVGKTALAVHWGHRVRDHFPSGQLYVDLRGFSAGSPLTPLEALAGFLHALGLRGADIPATVDRAATTYRSLLADQRVLVVLDNAANADQVRPLLPAGDGCVALVTSRDLLGGLVARDGAHRIGLDVLSLSEARTLLEQMLGAARVRDEAQPAAELAELCGYLPLALRIAAANLATQPRHRIADQVAQLRAQDRLATLSVGGDRPSAVAAAFDLSYTRLPAPAQRMFRLLGLAPGPDLSGQAAAALADVPAPQAASLLDTLVRAHLAEEPTPGRYACHDLLRTYAADRAAREETEPDRTAARQRLFDWYLQATLAANDLLYPHMLRLPEVGTPADGLPPAPFNGPDQARVWLEAERANLVATITHVAEHGPRPMAWRLTHRLRGFWWQGGHLVDGLRVADAALAAASSEADPVGQASARLTLGAIAVEQGDQPTALAHLEAATTLARQAGWSGGEAAALGSRGVVHARQGRLDPAVAHLTEAREIERRIGPSGTLATTSNILGGIHHDLGQLTRAAECYAESLASYRQLDAAPIAYAIPLSNLATVVRDLGRLDEALDHASKALSISRESGHRPGEAIAQEALAKVHCDAGRYSAALDAAEAAVALADELGFRTADAAARIALGAIHRGLRQPQQAVHHYRQALELASQSSEQGNQADALLGLAGAHYDLGEHDPAQAWARQALDAARERGYRLREGRALTALAEIHLGRRDLAQARQYAEPALANHRDTGYRFGEARTRLLLGQIYSQAGDPAAARDHWRQAHAELVDIGAPEASQAAALLTAGRAPGTDYRG